MKGEKETSKYYLKILHAISKQKFLAQNMKKTKIADNMTQIPSSIKPFSIPKDIELHEIFNSMLNSFYKLNGNNSFYTKLSVIEEKKRTHIFQLIKSFLSLNNFQSISKILCHIMFLFDIFMSKNKTKQLLGSPYQIAICAVSLTVKLLLGNNCFSNSNVRILDIFEQENFDKYQISFAEINCLKLIDYYLHLPSPSFFMEFFFINGIIFSNDDIKNKNNYEIYRLSNEILEKIICSSNIYIKYNPLYLCCCVVSYAREIYNLEKWPETLEKLSYVHFPSFEIIYNQFYKLIIKNQNISIKENQISYQEKNNTIEVNHNINKNIKIYPTKSAVSTIVTSSCSNKFRTPFKINGEKQIYNDISKSNYSNHHKKIFTNINDRNKDSDMKIIYTNYSNYKNTTIKVHEKNFDENLNKENERNCFSSCKSTIDVNRQNKQIHNFVKNLVVSDCSNEVTSDNSKNISNFKNNKINKNLNQRQNNKINDIIFGDFNYNNYNICYKKKNNFCQSNAQQKVIVIRKPGKNNNLHNSVKSIKDLPFNLKKLYK